MLVILLLAVNTMSLPFGASAMGLAEKEIYPREEENFGFLEGRWKALAGLQKRGLGGRGKQVTGVKKQSGSPPGLNPLPNITHCVIRVLYFCVLIADPYYRELCSIRTISGGVRESSNGSFC